MRVLVTGGAGFIGSHLIRALLERGDEVTVLDNFDPAYDVALKRANIAGLPIDLVEGDVRDRVAVEDALHGVDSVVHLAAKAGVRESLIHPTEYASVNVSGTVNLLEALRERGRIPVVFAGSSSVYGERESGPFLETDPLGLPASPYAGTKRAAEQMCHNAHLGWGQPVTVLRFFTVYGPRQRPAMAISKFIHMALEGQTIPLFGEGETRRDYTFVTDVVSAVLAAVDKPLGFGLFNVGGGRPVTLSALVEAIGEATGRTISVEHLDRQPGDVSLTWADARAIKDALGWQANTLLVDGLRQTVEAINA